METLSLQENPEMEQILEFNSEILSIYSRVAGYIHCSVLLNLVQYIWCKVGFLKTIQEVYTVYEMTEEILRAYYAFKDIPASELFILRTH